MMDPQPYTNPKIEIRSAKKNDEGSINLARANKKATLKCKKIIIKTLAKLYESVYCHSKYNSNKTNKMTFVEKPTPRKY